MYCLLLYPMLLMESTDVLSPTIPCATAIRVLSALVVVVTRAVVVSVCIG